MYCTMVPYTTALSMHSNDDDMVRLPNMRRAFLGLYEVPFVRNR